MFRRSCDDSCMHGSTNFHPNLEMYMIFILAFITKSCSDGVSMLTFCRRSVCAHEFTCPLYFFLRGYGGQIHATCCTCHSLAGRKHSRFVCTVCCALVDTGSPVTTISLNCFCNCHGAIGHREGGNWKSRNRKRDGSENGNENGNGSGMGTA